MIWAPTKMPPIWRSDSLYHSAKGSEWEDHKYVKR